MTLMEMDDGIDSKVYLPNNDLTPTNITIGN